VALALPDPPEAMAILVLAGVGVLLLAMLAVFVDGSASRAGGQPVGGLVAARDAAAPRRRAAAPRTVRPWATAGAAATRIAPAARWALRARGVPPTARPFG
jgi:hypothetical protein